MHFPQRFRLRRLSTVGVRIDYSTGRIRCRFAFIFALAFTFAIGPFL
jgi:hypothetical protein